MPAARQSSLIAVPSYDLVRARQAINGVDTVFHSHHYLCLCTQLADDAVHFAGKEILRAASERTFAKVLRGTMTAQGVSSQDERVGVIEEYWASCGMGLLRIPSAHPGGGRAVMESSHVDQAWAGKFGRRPQPVNFITQGYLGAAFAVLFDRPEGSFAVTETASIVSGADKSIFAITRK